MNNIQDTLLFPFRDRNAWTQFLIACAIMLAAFIIPLLPSILLIGYTVKIMRAVILEKRSPSMPQWQGSDWGEMFMDGLRLYGAQFVLMLPLFLLLGCGMVSLIGGSAGLSALASDDVQFLAPFGGLLLFLGIALTLLFSLLSLPYSIITSAATGHVVAKNSFQAAFEFREWWQVFRAAVGPFLIAYAIIMAISFVLVMVMQIAMITIVLMCIVPFLMIPYSVYLILLTSTLYAQAYAKGQEALQAA